MTTAFLDAFFHHAQARPDAWAWQAEDGSGQTYAQLAQAVLARVRAGVPAALSGEAGERVMVEDWGHSGVERLVWTAASQLLDMPSWPCLATKALAGPTTCWNCGLLTSWWTSRIIPCLRPLGGQILLATVLRRSL